MKLSELYPTWTRLRVLTSDCNKLNHDNCNGEFYSNGEIDELVICTCACHRPKGAAA